MNKCSSIGLKICDSWALQASVAPLPRDWKCRSGRPCHTWLRTTE